MDNTVRVWRTSTGELVKTIGEPSTAKFSSLRYDAVAFSTQGGLLACAGCGDNGDHIDLLTVHDGEVVSSINVPVQVRSMVFSTDGKRLFASLPGSGGLVWRFREAEAEWMQANVMAVAYDTRNQGLISVGSRGAGVTFWSANTRDAIAHLPEPPSALSMSLSADGSVLAAGDSEGNVWVLKRASAS
jgi:WD40 repeat protein